jgi:6-pyruvoyl-tetrahydropterin synthase
MRRMEMLLSFSLPATHSLDEREEAHSHVWQIQVGVTGPLREGRVESMPLLREIFEPEVVKLKDTFLNNNSHIEEMLRLYPTCENLCLHFEHALSNCLNQAGLSIQLTSIEVAVQELTGEETGSARLMLA